MLLELLVINKHILLFFSNKYCHHCYVAELTFSRYIYVVKRNDEKRKI